MKRKSIPESRNIPARKISRRDSIRELGEIGSREGDGEGGGEVEGEPGEHKEMGEELEEEAPEILAFQKKAIYRQMLEYKRTSESCLQEAEALTIQKDHYQDKVTTIYKYWMGFVEQLNILLLICDRYCGEDEVRKNSTIETATGLIAHDPGFLFNLLNFTSPQDFDKQVGERWKDIQHVLSNLKLKFEKIIARNYSSPKSDDHFEKLVAEVQEKCNYYSQQLSHMQSEFEKIKANYALLHERFEESEHALRLANRQIDRLKLNPPLSIPATQELVQPVVSNQITNDQDQVENNQKLLQQQHISQTRLYEIQTLRTQKQNLQNQVNQLIIDPIPQEKIKEHVYCKSLELDLGFQRAKHQEYKLLYTALTSKQATIDATNKVFKQTVLDESREEKAKVLEEMKKLETDLVRVRAGRDQVQSLLEQRVAKDGVEFLQVKEIRDLANERRDRIECLQSQCDRLEMEVELLKKGKEESNGDPDLLEQIQFHEKTKEMLMNEMKVMCASWQSLEEQKATKVINLAQKEDAIIRLTVEKVKMEGKIGAIIKQNTMYNNNMIALKRLSERQGEHIKRLEEREKVLTQQLHALEKEIQAREALNEKQKLISSEAIQERDALLLKNDASTATLLRTQTVLVDRERELEKSLNDQARLQEQLTTCESKLALSTNPNAQGQDTSLLKELENYKLLLKCSSCNIRFKTHCLSRCMHCFCKECIDDVLEARQRKCMACGIPFGSADVKQIYL